MKNYLIWNSHREDGENEPKEPSWENVKERRYQTNHTSMDDDDDVADDEPRPEYVREVQMGNTMADDAVIYGLDQMICVVESLNS